MFRVCRDEILTRPAGTDTIIWENQIQFQKGGTIFHPVFV